MSLGCREIRYLSLIHICCGSDLDVVTNIYHYVIENITYDEEKAENVAYGYVPDVDETLSSGKGICFDYAALMAAMLRSQRIPTKLQVGYAGEAYHAWISCYVDEIGWVDNMISFDGKDWSCLLYTSWNTICRLEPDCRYQDRYRNCRCKGGW